MRLTRGDTVGGFDAVAVRDVLRRCLPTFGRHRFADLLGVDQRRADQVLDALVESGHLRCGEHKDEFETTISGGALRSASLRPPATRAAAQRQLHDFLGRVDDANGSGEWLHWIDEVRLFGSMLDSSIERVGDVDLAVALTRRRPDVDYVESALEFSRTANRAGRRFGTMVEALYWPETSLMRYLRGRGTLLQLTRETDGVLKVAASTIIYDRRRGPDEDDLRA